MLKLNLKTLCKSFVAATALTLALASAPVLAGPGNQHGNGSSDSDNSFADGTTRKLLSTKDLATLKEFSETSRALLERALRKADGASVEERSRILLAAIRDVSITSYRLHSGAELLMRFALNQALDLTYGIPTADGLGLARQGVLVHCGNEVLMAKILEDSVRLALRYYNDDRKAVETGNLLELPFNRFSTERLKMARERWVPVIGDNWGPAYDLQVAALYQWMEAANHEQNPHRVEAADELTQTNTVLASLPPPPRRPARGEALARIVRGVLRDHMTWLTDSMSIKFGRAPQEIQVVVVEDSKE